MRKLIKWFLIIALLLGTAAITVYYFSARDNGMNILLLGADEVEKNSRHSDTIMAAVMDLKAVKITFFSIPRDTLVNYGGREMKINSIYASVFVKRGHAAAADEVRKEVEKLAGLSILYYFMVDYGAVEEIVDLFGGIKLDIKKSMRYTDTAGGLYIDFKPGLQKLDGKAAVKYLRFRSDPAADIGRIERQQKFVAAFLDKAKTRLTPEKIPKVYSIIKRNVKTNLPVGNVIRLYTVFRNYRLSDARMETLPGEPVNINGISYWKTDARETRTALRKQEHIREE